jgi:hypothetical protein
LTSAFISRSLQVTAPQAGQVAGRIGSTVPQAMLGTAICRSPPRAASHAGNGHLPVAALARNAGVPVSMLVGYFRMNQD